jgi:hypothetical protein
LRTTGRRRRINTRRGGISEEPCHSSYVVPFDRNEPDIRRQGATATGAEQGSAGEIARFARLHPFPKVDAAAVIRKQRDDRTKHIADVIAAAKRS